MPSLFLTLKSSLLSIHLHANDQGFWLSYHLWLYTLHSSFPGFVSVSLYVGLHRTFPSSNYLSWAKLKMSSKTKQNKQNSPRRSVGNFPSKMNWNFRLRDRVKSIFILSWNQHGGWGVRGIHLVTTLELGHVQIADQKSENSECINRHHVFPKFVLHISKVFRDCRIFYCGHAKFWMFIK